MSIALGAITVGIDGSQSADAAETWAFDEARSRGAPLQLVTAIPIASLGGEVDLLLDARAERLRRRGGGIDVSSHAVVGDARQVLLAASSRASLLVIGSRCHGALRAAVRGSVGTAVTARAPSRSRSTTRVGTR